MKIGTKKNEIHCCLGCGRETASITKLCAQCRQVDIPFTNEMKDRTPIGTHLIGAGVAEGMGLGERDTGEGRPRQYWLRREN